MTWQVGAYLAFVLTFSRVLSIGLEWAIPVGTRALAIWVETAGLRASLAREIDSGDDVAAIKSRAPWAYQYIAPCGSHSAQPPVATAAMCPYSCHERQCPDPRGDQ
jgi:hypothetical protein